MATDSAYQVIARRWRPKNFSDLVGQGHIVQTLSNAIERNRIAHAYLFVGPRGTGKTSMARLFAMAMNANCYPKINFDPEDEISQEIARGTCIDVIEIDGASNNSVDQIRNLREECQYSPAKCRFKIYIIDEVHMLSTAAFNALLKTLEEPPMHVKFIFATTESQKVLPTIVSRCQRFEFRPISKKCIQEKLQQIASADGINIDSGALNIISRLANGGMRDAQSILDQMVSFCGKKITESDVISAYGLISEEKLSKLSAAILSGDYKAVLSIADEICDSNCDIYKVLCDLEDYIHLLISNDVLKNNQALPEIKIRVLDSINANKQRVQSGLSEKMNFDVVLLKATESGQSRPIDSIIKMLREK